MYNRTCLNILLFFLGFFTVFGLVGNAYAHGDVCTPHRFDELRDEPNHDFYDPPNLYTNVHDNTEGEWGCKDDLRPNTWYKRSSSDMLLIVDECYIDKYDRNRQPYSYKYYDESIPGCEYGCPDPEPLPDTDGDGIVDRCDSHPNNPDFGKYLYPTISYYQGGELVGEQLNPDHNDPLLSSWTWGNTTSSETTAVVEIGKPPPVARILNPIWDEDTCSYGPCRVEFLDPATGEPLPDADVDAPDYGNWDDGEPFAGDDPDDPDYTEPVAHPEIDDTPQLNLPQEMPDKVVESDIDDPGDSAATGVYDQNIAQGLANLQRSQSLDTASTLRSEAHLDRIAATAGVSEDHLQRISASVDGIAEQLELIAEPDEPIDMTGVEELLDGSGATFDDPGPGLTRSDLDHVITDLEFELDAATPDQMDLAAEYSAMADSAPPEFLALFDWEVQLSETSSVLHFDAIPVIGVPASSYDLAQWDDHWSSMGYVLLFCAGIYSIMIIVARD